MSDFAGSASVHKDVEFGLALHVDEPGRNDEAVGVDALSGGSIVEIAHGCDTVAFDRNITEMPGCAGAINNARAGDDEIVRGLLGVKE